MRILKQLTVAEDIHTLFVKALIILVLILQIKLIQVNLKKKPHLIFIEKVMLVCYLQRYC